MDADMARKDLGPVSDLIATLDLPDETKQFIAEQYQAGKITIQGIRDLAREVATRVVEAGREGPTPGITKATASRDFYIALGDFDAGLTGIETVVQAAENAKKVGLKLEVPRPKWLRILGCRRISKTFCTNSTSLAISQNQPLNS